jgi:hypothetical protein
MRGIITTLLEVVGLVGVTVGVGVELGVGWALVAGGASMVVLGYRNGGDV